MADSILILNDDCFLELFQYLSVIDLANLKGAYKCLGVVADMGFSKKTKGSVKPRHYANIYEVLQIITYFGSSVSHLAITNNSSTEVMWSDIFLVIAEYCTEKLKSLSLVGAAVTRITEPDASLIVDILRNIETLEMDVVKGCYAGNSYDYFAVLSHCENIRSITLQYAGCIYLPQTIFRKNKNLLQLKIRHWIEDHDLKQIVDNLMETRLKRLLVWIKKTTSIEGNVSELLRLNYLKRLSIYFGHTNSLDVNNFLRNVDALKSLNALVISAATLDDTSIATLGRIQSLKVLQLVNCQFVTSSPFQSVLVLCGNKNIEHLKFLYQSTVSINPLANFESIDKPKFLKIIEKRKVSAAENCLHLTFFQKPYTDSLKAIPARLLEASNETIKLIDPHDCNYKYYYVV